MTVEGHDGPERVTLEKVEAGRIEAGQEIMLDGLIRKVWATGSGEYASALRFDLGDRRAQFEWAEPVWRLAAARLTVGGAKGHEYDLPDHPALAAPEAPAGQGDGPTGEQIRAGARAIKEWDEAQPKNAGARAVQRTEISEAVLRRCAAS